MILPRFGRWSSFHGRWFVWNRIWRKGYKWTPFCRVKRRYSPKRTLPERPMLEPSCSDDDFTAGALDITVRLEE